MSTVHRKQAGVSYVEVVIATAILAMSLVPMLEALQTAFLGAAVHEEVSQAQLRIAASMEALLAEPFADLDAAALAAGDATAPSSYSEPGGSPDRLVVYLSRYDGDNADGDNLPFTGVDAGLVWMRVAIENTAYGLETLTSP